MKKTISLFLLSCIAVFSGCSEIQTEENITETLPETEISIIAMGDSLTYGYGLENPERDSYPAQLERKLQADGYDVSIENLGISGETTTGGRERTQWVAESKADIVLLFLGANDMFRGIDPEIVEKNLREIVDVFLAQNTEVILMPMQSQSGLGEKYQNAFDGLYEKIATEKNITLTSFPLENIALVPDLNLEDGIHPTAEGYTLMIENIYNVIESEIRTL